MVFEDFNKVDTILEENTMSYYSKSLHRIDKAQPQKASWVSVDADISSGYACEQVNIIGYRTAEEMAEEVVDFVKTVFTPELLQLVRDGSIENLSFRIGPKTISSNDLNWANGVDRLFYDKKAD